jgi:hypothetical protein
MIAIVKQNTAARTQGINRVRRGRDARDLAARPGPEPSSWRLLIPAFQAMIKQEQWLRLVSLRPSLERSSL